MAEEEREGMYPRETADPGGRNLTPDAVRHGPTDGGHTEDDETRASRSGREALPPDTVIPEGADAQTSVGSGGQARYEGVETLVDQGAHGPGGDPAPNAP